MECPHCGATHVCKNGHRGHKQAYMCRGCGKQFLESYQPREYSDDVKDICLKMYLNGMGFRGIERVTGICHNTMINWIREVDQSLPDAPEPEAVPEVGKLDELETFAGSKKTKFWIWTAVNHFVAGILAWVVGDHSAETLRLLWSIVKLWKCYFYVTDRYKVYPKFIQDEDHIVSKTYMTRVEGENTRLRHYLARLHRKSLCYPHSAG